jgi:hypothetical protein
MQGRLPEPDDAYDRMCELVEQQVQAVWASQLTQMEA